MDPVDIAKPRTWVPFKPSLCASCWASCCHSMPVEVSVPDMIRMGFLDEKEAVSGSLKKAARRLKSEGIIRTFRQSTLIFVLEQRPNGDCIFLDKNRLCTVYEKRPEICRQFPKIGPKPGFCPYIKK